MKRISFWVQLGILAASLLILCGYIAVDRARTDSCAPEIQIEQGQIAISVHDDETALMQGITAHDDRDGDITDELIVESVYGMTDDHEVTVTYAAVDQAGNVAKIQRQVCYTDYESPRFSLSQPLVYEFSGYVDVMGSVGAHDILDGDLQRSIKATMLSSGTSVTEEGTHEVQFRVTNSVGDTAQLILPVEVYPVDSYNARLTLREYLIYLPRGAAFDASDYLDQFQFQNNNLRIGGTRNSAINVKTQGTVDTDTPGVYAVTYTAEYTSGSQRYTGYTKLLVVVEG